MFRLADQYDDKQVAKTANQQGLGIRPLSYYFDQQQPLNGLVIGFAGYTEEQIKQGADQLQSVLKNQHNR